MNGNRNNACLTRWEQWQAIYDFFCLASEQVRFNQIKEYLNSRNLNWDHVTSERFIAAGILSKVGDCAKNTFYSLSNETDPQFQEAVANFETVKNSAIFNPILKMVIPSPKVTYNVEIREMTIDDWKEKWREVKIALETSNRDRAQLQSQLEKAESYKEDAIKWRKLKSLLK